MPQTRDRFWRVIAVAAVVGGLPAFGLTPPATPPHAAVVGAPSLAPGAAPGLPHLPDPFPIRRVFTPPDRLPDLVARSLRGALVRWPRGEFEGRVRAAAAAVADIRPRVVEARYRARYDNGALTGTAEWRLTSYADTTVLCPWLLRLDPLTVAVHNPRWDSNTPAVLYSTVGDGPQVLVEAPGARALTVDWSARSVEGPSADRFDLTFPAASVATLELDLPADRVPTVTAESLLTGPFPGSAADRRLWRVGLGSGSRVALSVRNPPGEGQPGPAVRVHRTSRFEVSPGVAACTYEFDLEPIRELPASLLLETDRGLRITAVTGRDRLDWQMVPSGHPDTPPRLRVTNVRASTGRIVVAGFAALPAQSPGWPCPEVRVIDGLPGNDVIDVRVGSDVKFVGCNPADYRVTAAAADRGYRLSLAAAPLPAGRTDRRPPTLRLRHAGAEYTAVEDVTWRVSSSGTTLSARFRLRVSRGPVVQIPIDVSAGYTAEMVALTPDDPGVTWASRPGGLVIEPTRPATAGQTLDVRIDFRGPSARAGLNMPDIAPTATLHDALDRAGTFTVSVDPGLRAWTSPPPPDGESSNLFTYPFRNRPPELAITLAPRLRVAVATRDVRVSRSGGDLLTETTLRVRPDVGPVPPLLVFTPRRPGDEWSVRADGGTARPSPTGELLGWSGLLAASGAWPALAGVGLTDVVRGSVWHVEVAAPAGMATVTATVRRPEPPADVLPLLPVPTVLGADNSAATVAVVPGLAGRFAPPAGPLVEFPTTIQLSAPVATRPTSAGEWQFADLRLVNQVGADGGLVCRYSARVTAGPGTALPIGLPAGVSVEWATVNGRNIASLEATPPPASASHEPADWVRLPLPALPNGSRVEIAYRPRAVRHDSLLPRVVFPIESLAPKLPGHRGATPATWDLSSEYLLWDVAVSADELPARTTAIVVSSAALAAAGYALAAVVLGVTVVLTGSNRRSRLAATAFAAMVATCGVAAIFLAGWWAPVARPPVVAGMLAITWLAVTAIPRPTAALGSVARLSARSVLAWWWIVIAAPLIAQTSEPTTVYLAVIPESGQVAVFTPPATLKRLDDLIRPPVPGAIITDVEYEGTAESGSAPTFTGRFHLLCSRDGEHLATLPLSGVRLEGMTLDGQPAYPDASQPDRYAVTVRGAGRHKLHVRFVVVPTAAGADYEARFGVPDVPVCRVRFSGPPGATRLDIPSRRGTQMLTAGNSPTVDADHGGGKAVAVRWRAAAAGGSRPTVTVKETCIWDVSAAGEVATAAFLFRIEGGAVTRLAVEIPEGVEPGQPIVRGVAPQVGATTPDGPGLRDWRMGGPANGWRTVDLNLQSPAEGRVAVILRLVPRLPGSSRPVLRFPRAVGTAQADSFYAVRTTDVSIAAPARTGVIDYAPEALAREFAVVPELQLDRRPAGQAYQRTGESPEVRPTVQPLAETGSGTAEVTWTVGRRAEATGVFRVSRPGTSLVEFEIPDAVRVQDVRTGELESWGRVGSRVQVWLRKPADGVEVLWTGVLAEHPTHDPTTAANGSNVALPVPRLPDVATGPVTLHVRPAAGWCIEPIQEPAPPLDRDAGRTYRLSPQAAIPQVRVFAPQSPATAHLLEEITRAGVGVRYHARFALELAPRQPHRFLLRLTGLPKGATATAQGPSGTQLLPSGDASWDVSVPATDRPVSLDVSAEMPVTDPLPEAIVTFAGPPVPWTTRGMITTDHGLVPSPLPRGWRAPSPADRVRFRVTWPALLGGENAATLWVADTTARPWSVPSSARLPKSPTPPPHTPTTTPATEPLTAPPGPGDRLTPTVGEYAWAVAWVIGLVGLLALVAWGPPSWWTERLIVCGALGAVAVGAGTVFGIAFWSLTAAGVCVRLAKWVVHAARTVMA